MNKEQGLEIIKKKGFEKFEIEIFSKIEKAIKERNHFWWGCHVGIGYKSRVEVVRCDSDKKVKSENFESIAIIKYGSPYGKGSDGKFIKFIH